MNEKAYTKKMKGFLITEVILSLFVLTIGLTTTIALISTSLRQSFNNRDTIIAVELAQEGVELVRNVRDNGFILNSPGTPFNHFPSGKKHCHIGYTSNPSADIDCTGARGNDSDYLLRYTAGGFYNDSGGTATKFYRYLYVDYDNSEDRATVKSLVYWGGGTLGMFKVADVTNGNTSNCTVAKKCVFTEISLTNWR